MPGSKRDGKKRRSTADSTILDPTGSASKTSKGKRSEGGSTRKPSRTLRSLSGGIRSSPSSRAKTDHSGTKKDGSDLEQTKSLKASESAVSRGRSTHPVATGGPSSTVQPDQRIHPEKPQEVSANSAVNQTPPRGISLPLRRPPGPTRGAPFNPQPSNTVDSDGSLFQSFAAGPGRPPMQAYPRSEVPYIARQDSTLTEPSLAASSRQASGLSTEPYFSDDSVSGDERSEESRPQPPSSRISAPVPQDLSNWYQEQVRYNEGLLRKGYKTDPKWRTEGPSVAMDSRAFPSRAASGNSASHAPSSTALTRYPLNATGAGTNDEYGSHEDFDDGGSGDESSGDQYSEDEDAHGGQLMLDGPRGDRDHEAEQSLVVYG